MKIRIIGKAYLSVVIDSHCQVSHISLFNLDRIDIGGALKGFFDFAGGKISLEQKQKFFTGTGKQAELSVKDIYRFAAWLKNEMGNKKTPQISK